MKYKVVFIQRMGPMTASYRMRSEMPAKFLGGEVNGGEANILVFTKPLPQDLELAKESKADGIKIVVDIIDDHFRNQMIGPGYKEMVELADVVVTPTANMSDRLVKYGLRPADVIIPEAYEEPHGEPHASDGEKYLWFGAQGNLKDLRPWIKDGVFNGKHLTVVTGPNEGLGHEWTQWTPEVQTQALQESNIVVLPARKGIEYKSANRLVNAIRGGCFPVCGNLPSYQEFRRFAWVGNFATGVRWTQAMHSELNDRVREGQTYIQKFSPEAIGKQWEQVLEALGDTA
jgi:hypothetical protein